MHSHSLAPWQHEHAFLGKKHHEHERRTWAVVALATAMMIAEIVGGLLFGSMALWPTGSTCPRTSPPSRLRQSLTVLPARTCRTSGFRLEPANWGNSRPLRARSYWRWLRCSSDMSP